MNASKWARIVFISVIVVLLTLLFSQPIAAETCSHSAAESSTTGTFSVFIPLVARNYTPTVLTPPNDPYYPNQWAVQKVDMLSAWQYSRGDSILIAILDTGVDYAHDDLAGKLRADIDRDFVNDDDDAQDDNGHGTHVAGIAAAATNNAQGVVGVGWGAEVVSLKVLNNKGRGSLADIITAIYYATDQGAHIINMSLSTSADYDLPCSQVPAMVEALEYAYNHGVLVVVASGNDSADAARVIPANCPYVLTVAATDSSDAITSFSNYGDVVDMAAPGKNIYSTYLGNRYQFLSGTSMAVPFVAGVASLVFAAQPGYTATQVAAALVNHALDLGAAGWDPSFGWGRVDAAKAVQLGAGEGKSGYMRDPLTPQAPPSPMSLAMPPDAGSYVAQRLLVRFETEPTAGMAMANVQVAGIESLGNGLYLLSVAEGAEWEVADQLMASGAVAYAQPDFVVSVP